MLYADFDSPVPCYHSFKVVPINAVGRGLPSAATATVSARVGASPSQTTVRGGAVSVGMAGVVHETQVVTAYDTDGYFALTLGSWYGESLPIWANVATAGWDVSSTRNLLLEPNNDRVVASATAMEHALTAPGTGIEQVHVTRGAAAERDGHSGVSWTITFLSPLGECFFFFHSKPLLSLILFFSPLLHNCMYNFITKSPFFSLTFSYFFNTT